jgi:hypothetical protein
MRTSKAAHPQIREIMVPMCDEMASKGMISGSEVLNGCQPY